MTHLKSVISVLSCVFHAVYELIVGLVSSLSEVTTGKGGDGTSPNNSRVVPEGAIAIDVNTMGRKVHHLAQTHLEGMIPMRGSIHPVVALSDKLVIPVSICLLGNPLTEFGTHRLLLKRNPLAKRLRSDLRIGELTQPVDKIRKDLSQETQ